MIVGDHGPNSGGHRPIKDRGTRHLVTDTTKTLPGIGFDSDVGGRCV